MVNIEQAILPLSESESQTLKSKSELSRHCKWSLEFESPKNVTWVTLESVDCLVFFVLSTFHTMKKKHCVRDSLNVWETYQNELCVKGHQCLRLLLHSLRVCLKHWEMCCPALPRLYQAGTLNPSVRFSWLFIINVTFISHLIMVISNVNMSCSG